MNLFEQNNLISKLKKHLSDAHKFYENQFFLKNKEIDKLTKENELLKEQLVYMKLKLNRLESDNKHIEQKTINLKKALLVYG